MVLNWSGGTSDTGDQVESILWWSWTIMSNSWFDWIDSEELRRNLEAITKIVREVVEEFGIKELSDKKLTDIILAFFKKFKRFPADSKSDREEIWTLLLFNEITSEKIFRIFDKINDFEPKNNLWKGYLKNMVDHEPTLHEPKSSERSKEIDWSDPRSVKIYLDKFVYGQEAAKKALANAFCDYMSHGIVSHSLLMGPSGSGKTFMLKLLCDAAGVAFVRKSLANVTSEWYKWENLSDILKWLSWRQKGIIFFDEFDKIVPNSDKPAEGFWERIQKELLAYFSWEKIHGVDTSKFMIVCAWAFQWWFGERSLKGIIQARVWGNMSKMKDQEILAQATNQDLQQYGLMPELVGRIVNKAPLEALDENALYNILATTENSPSKKKEKDFLKYGIVLIFEDQALKEIATLSSKSVWARWLEAIINQVTEKYSFERKSYAGKTVVINAWEVKKAVVKDVSFEKVDDIVVDWDDVQSIVGYLDAYVVWQGEAKENLALAFYMFSQWLENPGLELPKANTLMIWPSGSGKTFLVETLAKKAGIPVFKINMLSITWRGQLEEELFKVAQAWKWIIYLDEIDKVLLNPSHPLRQDLINYLERWEINGVSLSNCMFIMTGAFQDLFEQKRRQTWGATMWFQKGEADWDYSGISITQDDLLAIGIPHEIIWRTPNIVQVRWLQKGDIVQILKIKWWSLQEFINIFKLRWIEVELDDGTLGVIASKIDIKIWARSLKPILQKLFSPYITRKKAIHWNTLKITQEDAQQILW